ncbi:tail fiber protein [Roseibacillus ishigakijimensis]|uniref:Tail fiber protein n=1 Tax=Roseibacillus ishigakijimensis TaxID=454146 RepID=A0A934RQG8_9BACT|nr:phage tail protein [Roseibacillus ishigakijimensis]MBK1835058.1 tail fiber protein [Roseibacillus ishigakijimensis]
MKTTIPILIAMAGLAPAAPQLLPFQGHLTDASGSAIADGAKVVQFKIYDAPVSGTAVWAGEVHKLSVNGGLVNTILGTKTAFPERYAAETKIMFSEPLYVEVTIDADGDQTITAADPPLLPRQVLLPANFAHVAMSAETVEGVDLLQDDMTGKKLNPSVLQEGSIPGGALVSDSVSAVEMAEGSVESEEIADGSIQRVDLSPEVITATVPTGSIMPFAGPELDPVSGLSNIPDGWLLCDGSALYSGDYQSLYEAIHQQWGDGTEAGVDALFSPVIGGGNVTDFNLPDLRGYFLRGKSGPSGRDPDAADRDDTMDVGGNIVDLEISGQKTGNEVGSVQAHEYGAHAHLMINPGADNSGGSPNPSNGAGNSPHILNTTGAYGGYNYRLKGTSGLPTQGLTSKSGGNETRPANAYVNYIIKY